MRSFFVILTLLLQTSSLSRALSSSTNVSTATTRSSSSSDSSTAPQCSDLDISKLRSDLASGRVHHHRNFLNEAQVGALLEQAEHLRQSGAFAPSGLSNTQKGKDQYFGEADRTVCPLPWWKDSIAGNHATAGVSGDNTNKESADLRISTSRKLQDLRLLLSKELNRPTMARVDDSIAHECYYSRSTAGATLARHMDERHEETKGRNGWILPSRRSVSWLVYLSDPDWDVSSNGGALRSFPQRSVRTSPGGVETGCHNGNLQVGWLVNDGADSIPVYLDSFHRTVNESGDAEPQCILYIVPSPRDANQVEYITQPWLNEGLQGMSAADFLKVVSESEAKTKNANLFTKQSYARDFQLLEDRPLWDSGGDPAGSVAVDIPPERGSLVVFDSVSVPHEVGLVEEGTRVALAGWFHEATQTFPEGFYDDV